MQALRRQWVATAPAAAAAVALLLLGRSELTLPSCACLDTDGEGGGRLSQAWVEQAAVLEHRSTSRAIAGLRRCARQVCDRYSRGSDLRASADRSRRQGQEPVQWAVLRRSLCCCQVADGVAESGRRMFAPPADMGWLCTARAPGGRRIAVALQHRLPAVDASCDPGPAMRMRSAAQRCPGRPAVHQRRS